MSEIQEIVTLKSPKVNKVTVLVLFSKNHDASMPLEIIQKSLEEL